MAQSQLPVKEKPKQRRVLKCGIQPSEALFSKLALTRGRLLELSDVCGDLAALGLPYGAASLRGAIVCVTLAGGSVAARRLISFEDGESVCVEGPRGVSCSLPLASVLEEEPTDAQWRQACVEAAGHLLRGDIRHWTHAEVRFTMQHLRVLRAAQDIITSSQASETGGQQPAGQRALGAQEPGPTPSGPAGQRQGAGSSDGGGSGGSPASVVTAPGWMRPRHLARRQATGDDALRELLHRELQKHARMPDAEWREHAARLQPFKPAVVEEMLQKEASAPAGAGPSSAGAALGPATMALGPAGRQQPAADGAAATPRRGLAATKTIHQARADRLVAEAMRRVPGSASQPASRSGSGEHPPARASQQHAPPLQGEAVAEAGPSAPPPPNTAIVPATSPQSPTAAESSEDTEEPTGDDGLGGAASAGAGSPGARKRWRPSSPPPRGQRSGQAGLPTPPAKRRVHMRNVMFLDDGREVVVKLRDARPPQVKPEASEGLTVGALIKQDPDSSNGLAAFSAPGPVLDEELGGQVAGGAAAPEADLGPAGSCRSPAPQQQPEQAMPQPSPPARARDPSPTRPPAQQQPPSRPQTIGQSSAAKQGPRRVDAGAAQGTAGGSALPRATPHEGRPVPAQGSSGPEPHLEGGPEREMPSPAAQRQLQTRPQGQPHLQLRGQGQRPQQQSVSDGQPQSRPQPQSPAQRQGPSWLRTGTQLARAGAATSPRNVRGASQPGPSQGRLSGSPASAAAPTATPLAPARQSSAPSLGQRVPSGSHAAAVPRQTAPPAASSLAFPAALDSTPRARAVAAATAVERAAAAGVAAERAAAAAARTAAAGVAAERAAAATQAAAIEHAGASEPAASLCPSPQGPPRSSPPAASAGVPDQASPAQRPAVPVRKKPAAKRSPIGGGTRPPPQPATAAAALASAEAAAQLDPTAAHAAEAAGACPGVGRSTGGQAEAGHEQTLRSASAGAGDNESLEAGPAAGSAPLPSPFAAAIPAGLDHTAFDLESSPLGVTAIALPAGQRLSSQPPASATPLLTAAASSLPATAAVASAQAAAAPSVFAADGLGQKPHPAPPPQAALGTASAAATVAGTTSGPAHRTPPGAAGANPPTPPRSPLKPTPTVRLPAAVSMPLPSTPWDGPRSSLAAAPSSAHPSGAEPGVRPTPPWSPHASPQALKRRDGEAGGPEPMQGVNEEGDRRRVQILSMSALYEKDWPSPDGAWSHEEKRRDFRKKYPDDHRSLRKALKEVAAARAAEDRARGLPVEDWRQAENLPGEGAPPTWACYNTGESPVFGACVEVGTTGSAGFAAAAEAAVPGGAAAAATGLAAASERAPVEAEAEAEAAAAAAAVAQDGPAQRGEDSAARARPGSPVTAAAGGGAANQGFDGHSATLPCEGVARDADSDRFGRPTDGVGRGGSAGASQQRPQRLDGRSWGGAAEPGARRDEGRGNDAAGGGPGAGGTDGRGPEPRGDGCSSANRRSQEAGSSGTRVADSGRRGDGEERRRSVDRRRGASPSDHGGRDGGGGSLSPPPPVRGAATGVNQAAVDDSPAPRSSEGRNPVVLTGGPRPRGRDRIWDRSRGQSRGRSRSRSAEGDRDGYQYRSRDGRGDWRQDRGQGRGRGGSRDRSVDRRGDQSGDLSRGRSRDPVSRSPELEHLSPRSQGGAEPTAPPAASPGPDAATTARAASPSPPRLLPGSDGPRASVASPPRGERHLQLMAELDRLEAHTEQQQQWAAGGRQGMAAAAASPGLDAAAFPLLTRMSAPQLANARALHARVRQRRVGGGVERGRASPGLLAAAGPEALQPLSAAPPATPTTQLADGAERGVQELARPEV